MAKMRKLGAAGPLFDLIRAIYSSLHSSVRTSEGLSEVFKNEIGVLQGDPLSGLLWIIYISDVDLRVTGKNPRISTKLIRMLMMADDFALVAHTQEELALLLKELNQYCKDTLLERSTAKTLTMQITFSKSRTNTAAADPLAWEIELNGSEIMEEKFAQYIGLCFESCSPLTYEKHVSKLAAKGNFFGQQLLELQRICDHQLDMAEMVDFYRSHVRSKTLFGSAITFASNSSKLDMTERTFLRRLLELPDTACVHGLYIEVGMMLIQMERVRAAISFAMYASSASAPKLIRAALRDNMNLPSAQNTRTPSW